MPGRLHPIAEDMLGKTVKGRVSEYKVESYIGGGGYGFVHEAVDVKTNKIIAISRKTVTQVDLAEHIAAKSALQKAAGEATVELLPQLVDEWNKLRKQEAEEKK